MVNKKTWKITYKDLSYKTKSAREMYRARFFKDQNGALDWLSKQKDALEIMYNGEASWSEHREFRRELSATA